MGGDGGPAAAAEVGAVQGLAFDAWQAICTSAIPISSVVRKVSAGAVVSLYAGDGTPGFGGDGGPAAQARLNFPAGISPTSKATCLSPIP